MQLLQRSNAAQRAHASVRCRLERTREARLAFWHDGVVKFRRPAYMVVGLLIGAVACGRIGFDAPRRGPEDAVTVDGAATPADGSSVDAGLCDYLPTCRMGEITCCAAAGSFCTIESPGACTGTIARCSIFTQQGCPTGWACCSTQQRPEPSCYSPLMPQPC